MRQNVTTRLFERYSVGTAWYGGYLFDAPWILLLNLWHRLVACCYCCCTGTLHASQIEPHHYHHYQQQQQPAQHMYRSASIYVGQCHTSCQQAGCRSFPSIRHSAREKTCRCLQPTANLQKLVPMTIMYVSSSGIYTTFSCPVRNACMPKLMASCAPKVLKWSTIRP